MNEFTIGETVPTESADDFEPTSTGVDPWIDDEPRATPAQRVTAVDEMVGFEPRALAERVGEADRVGRLRRELAEAERADAEYAERERQRREQIAAERAAAERELEVRVSAMETALRSLATATPTTTPAWPLRAAARRFTRALDVRVLIGCGDDTLIELAAMHAELERLLVNEQDSPSASRIDALEGEAFSALRKYAQALADPPGCDKYFHSLGA